MRLPVYVINLPGDDDRFAAIKEQVAPFPFIELVRIEGVRGGLLPDAACRTLTRNAFSVMHKGAIGCFLSHVRAWEAIALSDAPVCLLIEDDVKLRNLDLLEDIRPPSDLEIAFCNSRTAYPEDRPATGFRPLTPSVRFIESHGRAVGGDCYMLTPAAARRLIGFIEQDSFVSHVDLRLMAYAVPLSWTTEFPATGTIADDIARFQKGVALHHRLTGYSFWPVIGQHPASQAGSRRAAEDRASRLQAQASSLVPG